MRIKIGDLRDELKSIDQEIKTLTKRRSAVAGMIEVYGRSSDSTPPPG